MSCASCQAPTTEYFSTRGDPLCRVCYFAEQTSAQDARAIESLADEVGMTPEQFRAAGGSTQLAEPVSRGKMIMGGVALIGFSIALGIFEWFVLGQIHVIFIGALMLSGVGVLGKGLQTR